MKSSVSTRIERKKSNKRRMVIIWLFMGLCVIGLIISIFNITIWKNDSNNTKGQISEVQKKVDVIEVPDNEHTEIIEQEKVEPASPYWEYIGMDLINVDFQELKMINNQTKGWIQVNGTNINYPFVQNKDNKFYLTHSFDKTYNYAGWIFLDYRNDISKINRNTIIYGHGRLDRIMFGSLKNILTSGWLNNANNYVVKLSTEYENTLWQVFSVYHIPTTSDYIQTDFNDDKEFKVFVDMLTKRSAYNFKTTVNGTDKILTLSTCYNDKEKVVLHAKLIKRETK